MRLRPANAWQGDPVGILRCPRGTPTPGALPSPAWVRSAGTDRWPWHLLRGWVCGDDHLPDGMSTSLAVSSRTRSSSAYGPLGDRPCRRGTAFVPACVLDSQHVQRLFDDTNRVLLSGEIRTDGTGVLLMILQQTEQNMVPGVARSARWGDSLAPPARVVGEAGGRLGEMGSR